MAEARAWGADCILIIMASVEDGLAAELEDAARHWGMDALIEVHDAAELDRALALESRLIGINNRDLNTFETTLETTRALAPRVPEGRIAISESGLFTPADLADMAGCGARSFLIGESPHAAGGRGRRHARSARQPRPGVRMSGKLTHFDASGQAHMVDVSEKAATARLAVAEGHVRNDAGDAGAGGGGRREEG